MRTPFRILISSLSRYLNETGYVNSYIELWVLPRSTNIKATRCIFGGNQYIRWRAKFRTSNMLVKYLFWPLEFVLMSYLTNLNLNMYMQQWSTNYFPFVYFSDVCKWKHIITLQCRFPPEKCLTRVTRQYNKPDRNIVRFSDDTWKTVRYKNHI